MKELKNPMWPFTKVMEICDHEAELSTSPSSSGTASTQVAAQLKYLTYYDCKKEIIKLDQTFHLTYPMWDIHNKLCKGFAEPLSEQNYSYRL